MVKIDGSIIFQTLASKELIKWTHSQMTIYLKYISTIFEAIICMAKFEKVPF